MLLRISGLLLAIVSLGSADILTLRSGQTVRGEYLGGDARHVKMSVGDRVENYSIEDVASLEFNNGGGHQSDRDRNSSGYAEQQQPVPPPPPPAQYQNQNRNSSGFQIPVGTLLTVRLIDSVDSEKTRIGETFRASIDEPVVIDGQTVMPRGGDAVVKLVEDKQSGKFAGKTVLTLELQQVIVNGRTYDISTGDVSQASASRGARTGKVVGGTTAAGAIIGALAGGGKGAAIGAASGAAVGAGAQVMTKGQRVKIPSETRLTFTLQQPVQL
jgi:hypothetical protein